MKQTHAPDEIPETWSAESLYAKAERYVQKMANEEADSWEHALWSSLSLEFLARAALANVNPALLAEPGKNWDHLYASLGFTPNTPRYSPRSLPTNEVLTRLLAIFEGFTTSHKVFCVLHTGKRNAELHSGENAFDGTPGSNWHAKFYSTCSSLLDTMGISLEEFLGTEEATIANKLIAAAEDESAKAVLGDVAAHKNVWGAKEVAEREELTATAKVWATRQAGHRVSCPACASVALVNGEAISAPTRTLLDDQITEAQHHLPNQFECIACGLKVSGLSRLTGIGLADQYKKTTVYDAADFYAPEDEWNGYEEDNNER